MKKQIIRTNIDTLLYDVNLYDDKKIYELSENELSKFIDLYNQGEQLPKVLLISGNTAFDNLSGDCFGEDFETREQAVQYLYGMSYEDIIKNHDDDLSL